MLYGGNDHQQWDNHLLPPYDMDHQQISNQKEYGIGDEQEIIVVLWGMICNIPQIITCILCMGDKFTNDACMYIEHPVDVRLMFL